MIAQHEVTVLPPENINNEYPLIPAQQRAMSIAIFEQQATLERIEKLSRLLALSAFCPKHLVVANDPERTTATCFRVVAQADRWGVDPFAMASETYAVGGKLGYQGKLIAAVVNARAGLDGRLDYKFSGHGNDRTVEVIGKFKNEESPRTVTANLGDSKTSNEMWTKDPDQKLCYVGAIKWARRHCPEVVTGVLTAEDLEVMAEQTPPPPAPTAEELEAKRKEAAAKQAEAMRAAMGGGAVTNAASETPSSPQATPKATTAAATTTKAAKKSNAAVVDPPSPSEIATAPISAELKADIKALMNGGLGDLIDADEFNVHLAKHYKASTLSNLTNMQALDLKGWLLAEKEKRSVAKDETAAERDAIQSEAGDATDDTTFETTNETTNDNQSPADKPADEAAEACGEVVNGGTDQSNLEKSEGQPVSAEVSISPQAEASAASDSKDQPVALLTDKGTATATQIATIQSLIKQKDWKLNAPRSEPDYQSQTVYLKSKDAKTFRELSQFTAAKLIANLSSWDDAPAKN